MPLAKLAGTARSGHTSSAQANPRNKPTAGQTAPCVGTSSRRAALGQIRLTHSAVMRHGLTKAHTSPTSALTNARPTHQITQTAVGRMLSKASSCVPNRPAKISRRKAVTDTIRISPRTIGWARSRPTGVCNESNRGSGNVSARRPTNSTTITKDTATVAPAPTR